MRRGEDRGSTLSMAIRKEFFYAWDAMHEQHFNSSWHDTDTLVPICKFVVRSKVEISNARKIGERSPAGKTNERLFNFEENALHGQRGARE